MLTTGPISASLLPSLLSEFSESAILGVGQPSSSYYKAITASPESVLPVQSGTRQSLLDSSERISRVNTLGLEHSR